MSLSFISVGTVVFSATGAASVAPAPPAHSIGDLMVMAIGIHTTGTKTVTVPGDWPAVPNAEAVGGGGTFGADAGPSRAKLLYKVATDTSTSAVTVTLAGSETGSVAWAAIGICRATSGAYDVNGSNGIDITTGTPLTATMAADPGFAAGDLALVASSTPTDINGTANWTTPQTLTATGMTTTVTERVDTSSGTGNDIGAGMWTATIDTGPSSTAPTFSTVASGTTTNIRGPIVIARIRELVPVTGAALGAYTFGSTGSGAVGHTGTAAAAPSFTATANGTPGVLGAGAATLTFDATGSGIVTGGGVQGQAVGAYTLTGTANGTPGVLGQAVVNVTLGSAASGVPGVLGQAVANLGFGCTAQGVPGVLGAAACTPTFTGAASGQVVGSVQGQAVGAYTFGCTAQGVPGVLGQAVGAYTLLGQGAGTVGRAGTALAALTLTGVAAGLAVAPYTPQRSHFGGQSGSSTAHTSTHQSTGRHSQHTTGPTGAVS